MKRIYKRVSQEIYKKLMYKNGKAQSAYGYLFIEVVVKIFNKDLDKIGYSKHSFGTLTSYYVLKELL